MRKLADSFMQALTSGFLSGLIKRVREDKDLDLEIRDGYFNIYYKGNSLLKLDEMTSQRYRVDIHPKFTSGLTLPEYLIDEVTTGKLVQNIPLLKENIGQFGQSSLELEYEQLLIRTNNFEPRLSNEYFVIDSQYASNQRDRFDLTGFLWERQARQKRNQSVPLCLIEVKYAGNSDIQDVHQQLARYYKTIKTDASAFAEEVEGILMQKLDLGLIDQPVNRLKAMRNLKMSREIDHFQFILVLIDYNPSSSLFKTDQLEVLPFANQIRVFFAGFAMWQKNLRTLSEVREQRG